MNNSTVIPVNQESDNNSVYALLFVYLFSFFLPDFTNFVTPYFQYLVIFYKFIVEWTENYIFTFYLKSLGTDYFISSKKVDNKHMLITYKIQHQNYKLLLPIRKMPNNILQVTENEKDVTSLFIEYMGPKGDFHKQTYTPKDMGFSKLKILFDNDDVKTFEEHENIIL